MNESNINVNNEATKPNTSMAQSFFKKMLPKIGVALGIFLIGGLVVFALSPYLRQSTSDGKDNPRLSTNHSNEAAESEKLISLPENKEYEELNSLDKARYVINTIKSLDPYTIFIQENYNDLFSVYYYSTKAALVTAPDNEIKEGNGPQWNLYKVREDGKAEIIFRNLIKDCCGGGIPVVKSGDYSFIAAVETGTGDVCFYRKQKLYINTRNEPYDYHFIEHGNNCTSISDLKLGVNTNIYEFSPIMDVDCTQASAGTKVKFSGLKAVAGNTTYTKNFNSPIDMECRDKQDFSYRHSKYISYDDIKPASDMLETDEFVFTINLYENDQITNALPFKFSLRRGFLD